MKGTQIERNISRLSLIAAVNRVPTSATAWVRELQIDTLGIQRIECKSGRDQVIPHGTDNDLLVGLINAYVQQGMREDRLVRLSVSELLNLAGLEPCGSNYRATEHGLDRLNSAIFAVYDSWWDNTHHQFTETKFHIVERYRRTDRYEKQAEIGQFQATNLLEMQLAPEITNSIRSGYLRVLNPEIYHRLKQSLARTLYRTLEEIRTPVGATPVKQYSVLLGDWGNHLGLQSSATDKIRRSLEPAHTNLLETGYLKAVEYQGRGRSQVVVYSFGEVAPAASAASIALLTTRGVGHERAIAYAQTHSEDSLRQAVEQLDDIVIRSRKKVSNPPGLLLDIIDHPEKYPLTPTDSKKQDAPRKLAAAVEADELLEPLARAISPKERRDTFVKVVAMFKLHGDKLKQAAQNIEQDKLDIALVGDVQRRLVKLHMEGATNADKEAVLTELL